MNRTGKYALSVLAALLIGGTGAAWYLSSHPQVLLSFFSASDQHPSASGTVDQIPANEAQKMRMADSGNPLESIAAGLAVRGISLLQGDKGIDLWRLQASWAYMEQEGEKISVRQPDVRYSLGETSVSDPHNTNIIRVTADDGLITDGQRCLELRNHVVIRRGDDTVQGSEMRYDAGTRTILFPRGARYDSPGAKGRADTVRWNLASNIISAEGHVALDFSRRTAVSGKRP
ncbi:MAG: hypothetical protein PUB69_04025 [Desulfovibrionaceae bacterium]|nr:hypothetical protein [Desulfovibrionaceae bacterium]